jgi:hypothetical protein
MDKTAEVDNTMTTIAIGGPGGIGKTWLALHWAHRNAEHFPTGSSTSTYGGFDPSGTPTAPATALRGFLDALDVPVNRIPTDLDAQMGLYRSLTAGRRMLVVLDNAHDTEQVLPLLPGNPACAVLVTSRHRLTGLVTAHGAHLLTLDVIDDAAARELLTCHLGHERLAADRMPRRNWWGCAEGCHWRSASSPPARPCTRPSPCGR